MPSWKPQVWLLDPEWGPIWRQNPLKWKLGMYASAFWDLKVAPTWPKAPKCTQNDPKIDDSGIDCLWIMQCQVTFLQWQKNKWTSRNQIVPTSTKKTHTTQRGVGGMRRRPRIFWHKWEDWSRKVNMNAFNFSPGPWNFWPVMSQAVRKPCFSTSIPRGPHSKT